MRSDGKPERFRYFTGQEPAHYRWSAAMSTLLAVTRQGASTVGEIHRVGQRLADHVGDDEVWFTEWRAMGDSVRALGQSHEDAGRPLTASNAYLRASCYYQMGERFRVPKDQAALDAYQASVDCFHRFAQLTDRPTIETVEVPFEGTSLPAYFIPAASSATPGPAVVFFDGLDITKELQFMKVADEITRRGVACLIIDAPGTGEAIRFRGMPLRFDYEVAGTAALEYLAARPEVDPGRIGVMAISLGGYYAPRCASREPRFAACVAWGAIWDYHETWKRRIDAAYNSSLSVPGDHITWVLGVDTLDEALKKLEDFRLEGVVGDVRCPLLITHGEEDAQVPVADARKLYDAAGSQDKTLRVYTPEEGGAQHCQSDDPAEVVSFIGDWLKEKL